MAADRLLANFASQSGQSEGSEFDSIDLSAPAPRKAGSIVWAELGDVASEDESAADELQSLDFALPDSSSDLSLLIEEDVAPGDGDNREDDVSVAVEDAEGASADADADADAGDGAPVESDIDFYDTRFVADDPETMVLGTDAADVIEIGEGDFTYVKTHGGDDIVTLNVRGVVVYTGAGDDIVHGMTAYDIFEPTEGVYLGHGDDTFAFFGGNALVSGDDGDDTLILSGLDAAGLIFTIMPGEVSHDPSASYMLYIGSADGTSINVQVSGIEHIIFGDGTKLDVPADLADYVPDTYVYDAGTQSFISSSEVAVNPAEQLVDLYGSEDSEIIQGGSLHDNILAGSGDDTIYGGGGQDVVWGGDGSDLIYGNALEMFDGGIGMSNGAFGGAGDDILVHGGGFQAFDGGDGNDVIALAGGPSNYLVTHYAGDGLYGQGFNYTLVFEQNGMPIHIDLRNVEIIAFETGLTFALQEGTGEQDTHFLINPDGTTQTVDVAPAEGSAEPETGNELIFGTDGADLIDAGDGDDTVSAGKGNDTVFAGEGVDYLDGGRGYDTLVMTGTWSDYRFEYTGSQGMWLQDARDPADASTDGNDVVLDFEAYQFANETLSLKELIARGGQAVSGEGILHGTFGDDTISGSDGTDSVMAGSGSNIVSTYDGSDSIIAQEARVNVWAHNVVDAGDGDDTVWLGRNQADSEITGGGGNDYLGAGNGTTFAIYRGTISEYRIELSSSSPGDDGQPINNYIVEDQVGGRDGRDTVEGAITLKFADGTFNITDGTFDLLT